MFLILLSLTHYCETFIKQLFVDMFMTKYIAVIDEAGRGPLIGPLVIAVAAVPEDKEYLLKEMNVKDSKLLTELQRESILEKMRKIV